MDSEGTLFVTLITSLYVDQPVLAPSVSFTIIRISYVPNVAEDSGVKLVFHLLSEESYHNVDR